MSNIAFLQWYVVSLGTELFTGDSVFLESISLQDIISIVRKVYITDKNGKWVDFSDLTQKIGTDRLVNFGSIDTSGEKTFRHFYSKTGSVELRNTDRFFDQPFPEWDGTSSEVGIWHLKTVDGTPANFNKAISGVTNIFASKDNLTKIRLATEFQIAGYTAPVEVTLGTFLLKTISTDLSASTSISTDSLVKKLQKSDAELIKDGYNNWYRNAPVSFLVRLLLVKTFGYYSAGLKLPAGFVVPSFRTLYLSFPKSVFSIFGRPPTQLDTDSDNEPDTFPNYGLIPRAMAYYSTNKELFFGLDNELWKVNVEEGSTNYFLWVKVKEYSDTQIIERIQEINGALYIWFRNNFLHQVDSIIETSGANAVLDNDLRKINQTIIRRVISSGSETTVFSGIAYDTEFNYFPMIPMRLLRAKPVAGTYAHKLTHYFFGGNISWDESITDTAFDDDTNEGYSNNQQPSQAYSGVDFSTGNPSFIAHAAKAFKSDAVTPGGLDRKSVV